MSIFRHLLGGAAAADSHEATARASEPSRVGDIGQPDETRPPTRPRFGGSSPSSRSSRLSGRATLPPPRTCWPGWQTPTSP